MRGIMRVVARSSTPRQGRVRADLVLAAAFVVDTVIAVVDAFTDVVLINLVVAGPLIAATRTGPRRTALIAAYAVALGIYEGIPHHILGDPDHVVRVSAIALTGGLAVWSAWLRVRREAAQRHTALLAEAGALVNASLDDAATMSEVARLVVPALADCCVVHVLDREGAPRCLAVAEADARAAPLAAELRAGAAADLDREALGITALEVAPMVARGRELGTFTVATVAPRRDFDDTARATARELALRCALALDNAHQYRERSHVARTLQDSLLPARLPRVPGFEVAARFHAGSDIDVGGDFLDVFPVAGTWAAAVGDVSGKGAGAAAVTALARYTLRAVADGERPPSAVLRALNAALLREDLDERFCTAVYVALEPHASGATIRLCSAGHPPGMVVRLDGRVETVGAPGMVLGVLPGPPLVDVRVDLAPGEKLVLYTDGVTEARVDGGLLGVDGLAAALGACAEDDTVVTAERAYHAAVAGTHTGHDDIAVLVLRSARGDGAPRGQEGLARSGAAGRLGALDLRLTGGTEAPLVARRALDALTVPALPPDDAYRARLLASEIVTSAVRHAARTPSDWVAFEADLSPDVLRVRVSGHGGGGAQDVPPPGEISGHGLFVMQSLADRWGTSHDGRSVWFELDIGSAAPSSPV
jgi:serine phosphatase RsbU (regulator of sigma subunit)/anti-sigma regulatory factor (Ser/Thr protein kinase)